jgi:hypothetical protein
MPNNMFNARPRFVKHTIKCLKVTLLNLYGCKKEPYITDEILNNGLILAMAFGKNWIKPIQTRLGKIYPALSDDELEQYNTKCQEVMTFGHTTVYELAERYGKATDIKEFEGVFTSQYSWVTSKNINNIFSQGMYYAFKDMGF